MDSSTVVGLMRPMVEGDIHTFSFRCRGKSFDESHWARLMSERYNTRHHEVPYEAGDIDRIIEVVNISEEPFSDIGIEVASYLLAEKAGGTVDYVLTGDGGDELFAGHPVYLADKMASKFERVPGFIRQPLTRVLQHLPDTDAKKSLVVKAKRFSYSASFPADLFSNRWRIYYTEDELRKLLNPEWHVLMDKTNPLEDIRSLYDEADGADFLSKTLYGDYYTVVGFYLRRMELVRKFGLEGRFPRVLPDEIVFRKDKLGHSVPFKNWLRDVPVVKNLVQENLSAEALKKRGIFNPEFVDKLYRRHMSKADNNSHRLWALLVFELWCRNNLDKKNLKMEDVLQPV